MAAIWFRLEVEVVSCILCGMVCLPHAVRIVLILLTLMVFGPTRGRAGEGSVEVMRAKAERGDVAAQSSLGVWYHLGLLVEKDYDEARKWSEKAAEQGSADAQFNLGLMHYRGNGVRKDEIEACKWYYLAAAQGNKVAIVERDRITSGFSPAQLAQVRKRVSEFVVRHEAAYSSGDHHNQVPKVPEESPWKTTPDAARREVAAARTEEPESRREVPEPRREVPEPRREVAEPERRKVEPRKEAPVSDFGNDPLRVKAEQGDASAQNKLGERYEKGKGARPNLTEAAKWYRRAAMQGNAWAQQNLGLMYQKGAGVTRDYVEAYCWFELAVRTGGDWFANARNQLAAGMTPGQMIEAERRVSAFKACKE